MKIQVEKINAVLSAEAAANTLIAGLMCSSAGRCATGALVFAATGNNIGRYGATPDEVMAVESEFGVNEIMLDTIMGINDCKNTQEDRYQAVMAYVEFIRWMQDNGVDSFDAYFNDDEA